MSDEVIKTILTADSSELAAEFAKASAIAQKYAADREAQGSRALASARASVEALRLEATGHAGAAAALREKIQLQETARRLAQSTGLSEANALQIASRELALKKQIADQSARTERSATIAKQAAEEQAAWLRNRAAMEQASAARTARLNSPGRSGIGLPEMDLAQVLLMEKSLARASAVQRQIGNFGQGPKTGSAMGLLAVAGAVEDAQYGIKGVINNIPQAVMSFGNFTPAAMRLAAGLSLVAVAGYAAYKAGYALGNDKSIEEWAETQMKAVRAAQKAWDGNKDSTRQRREREASAERGAKMREDEAENIKRALELDEYRLATLDKQAAAVERKRAAEDALAAAMEKARGVAGMRGISEVRVEEDKRRLEDQAAAQARLNYLGEQMEAIWRKSGEMAGQYAAKARESDRAVEQAADSLDYLKSKQIEVNELLEGKGYSPTDRSRFKTALEDTKRQIAEREKIITEKSDEKRVNEELAKQAASQAKASMERLRQLMDVERDRISQLSELARQREKLRGLEDEAAARSVRNWKEELQIQKLLAAGDVQRVRDIERKRAIESETLRILQEQKGITEDQARKNAAKMVDARANASSAQAKSDYAAELEILRARAQGENKRAGSLRAARDMELAILDVMRQQNVSRSVATKLVQERNGAIRGQQRNDFLAEMMLLRMESRHGAKGAKKAELIREEIRIRSEAVGLAERLGVSEEKAQELLRQRAALEKRIADQRKNQSPRDQEENRRHRSLIYKKFSDEERLLPRGGAHGLQGARGLRNHELQRRATERSLRPSDRVEESAKTLLKSVNIQEEMLKLWRKLTVI